METKQQIVANWLPRYTGVPLDQFGEHILLTNFDRPAFWKGYPLVLSAIVDKNCFLNIEVLRAGVSQGVFTQELTGSVNVYQLNVNTIIGTDTPDGDTLRIYFDDAVDGEEDLCFVDVLEPPCNALLTIVPT